MSLLVERVTAGITLKTTLIRSFPLLQTQHTLTQGVFNSHDNRGYSSVRGSSQFDEDELNAARNWLANLDPDTIPQSLCDVSFSRSSGPGGQKVNKTSSKATLRLPIASLLPLLPAPLHSSVQASRYHARNSGDIVIQADDSRKQAENAQACHRRLLEMIRDAGKESIPGETSVEQMKHVAQLQKAEAAGRKRMKQYQSSKKSARRGGGRSDD